MQTLSTKLHGKHEEFIKEKQYLLNVSPATVDWYRQSLRWLDTESPDGAELKSSDTPCGTLG
jgi:integrase/recombinase XerD